MVIHTRFGVGSKIQAPEGSARIPNDHFHVGLLEAWWLSVIPDEGQWQIREII